MGVNCNALAMAVGYNNLRPRVYPSPAPPRSTTVAATGSRERDSVRDQEPPANKQDLLGDALAYMTIFGL